MCVCVYYEVADLIVEVLFYWVSTLCLKANSTSQGQVKWAMDAVSCMHDVIIAVLIVHVPKRDTSAS